MGIDISAAEVAGSLTWEPIVSSWLGTRWLADIPVAGGSVAWSTRREIPGSLDLTVPKFAPSHPGMPAQDWLPVGENHPLAAMGQVLSVSIRVSTLVSGRSWLIPQGRMLITESSEEAGRIRVQGESLTRYIVGDRFPSPMATRPGGTLKSEVRRLVPPQLGVSFDRWLEDRWVPTLSWDESRIAALAALAKAWPARLREDGVGIIRFLTPLAYSGHPDVTLTDGVNGTVVSAYRTQTRDGIHNAVVARGQETDSERPAVQAEAMQQTGPYAVDRFGVERKFFSSPLLTTIAAVEKAAATVLADSIRPARTIPVVAAPDPRIQLDSKIEIVTDAGLPTERRRMGWVSGYQMPLTPAESMRIDVEEA